MANRGITWDPLINTIEDLKEHGSRKMPKMYRGEHRNNPYVEAY